MFFKGDIVYKIVKNNNIKDSLHENAKVNTPSRYKLIKSVIYIAHMPVTQLRMRARNFKLHCVQWSSN